MKSIPRTRLSLLMLVCVAAVIALALAGCTGATGPAGPPGPNGSAGPAGAAGAAGAVGSFNAAVSGTVTNGSSAAPLAGATVATVPAIAGLTIQTKADGTYSATVPAGAYTLTISKTNYTSATISVNVAAGQTVNTKTTLAPNGKVIVSGTALTAQAPGASISIPAVVDALDGSTATTYKWSQVSGATATITDGATATAKVTLPNAAAYKAELVKNLKTLDRTMVQPINLGAIAAAQLTTFVLTVTTSSGTYSGNVNVSITLPFMVATGLADVPIQVPVLVHGKKAASYSWTMTAPSGSKAALADASTQDTYFTPDVAGKYTLKEATTGASLDIFGGTFVGALSGSDAKGQPLSASCTICHNGTLAPDNFTTWKTTGHAVVFTRAIGNTADHYAETCLACHSVGYEALGAKNNGINDQTDFAALQATGMLAAPTAANWAKILATYPKSATFTNIQCENCHGPNSSDTGLHPDGKIDAARVSLSSDVCGVCHGRPPTHSLFQQWQLSPHSNFVTASAESTNTSCARCHTAQGFLVWIKQADMTVSLTAAQLASANMTPDTAQPITCVVCHDPHDEGDMMATPPDPKVRIEGNTSMLPSGYQAIAVGKGAICITCHNTRNTAHNDSTGLRATTDQAPHSAAQGDVLLGENAYFVKTGIRGAHSLLEDTCATCHVEASPPPAPYTTASNHSFAASADICGDCHGAFKNGENLMAATEAKLVALGNKLASYTLSKLPATFMITDAISASNPTLIAKSNVKSLTPVEAHGRQGFTVTFVTPVKFTAATGGAISTLSEAEFQLSSLTAEDKTLVIPATDPLYKAGWNYWLIESDSSKGVHNPSWVSSVIQGAIDALK